MQGRNKLPYHYAGEHRQAGSPLRPLPAPPEWMTPGAAEKVREVADQLDRVGALAETD